MTNSRAEPIGPPCTSVGWPSSALCDISVRGHDRSLRGSAWDSTRRRNPTCFPPAVFPLEHSWRLRRLRQQFGASLPIFPASSPSPTPAPAVPAAAWPPRVSSLIEYVVSLATGHVTRHCPGKLWYLAQHSRQSAPRKVIAETLQQRTHLRRYGRTMFGQCCLATGSDRINSCATPALVSLN
jgi:hypothetical protein